MQFDNPVNTTIFRTLVSQTHHEANQKAPAALPFFEAIRDKVAACSDMEASYKSRIHQRIRDLSDQTLNLLVIGQKGAGKTETMKALFGGHDWQADQSDHTQQVTRHELNQLTIWQAELPHYSEPSPQLVGELGALLSETTDNGEPLIDRVIVVLDSASSNIDDCYLELCHTLIPMLGTMTENRLMILMNKADKVARHIRGTSVNETMPLDAEIWLDCTAATLRYRLIHNAGIQTRPLYYSALAGESPSGRPYNLQKLLANLLEKLPEEKRLLLLNQPFTLGDEQWREHDDKKIYRQSIENLCFDGLHLGARDGDRFGGQLGAFLGKHGRALGNIVSDTLQEQMGVTV
ncbi:GTPase family protein [Enterovibrio calviensis]|uniref:hypothetical protein n=1 Tax=Enterovibrio calviensis TaxID=91359 RepID=UPI000481175C|nr:hypothetical protein [Enterovibrio calviensis]